MEKDSRQELNQYYGEVKSARDKYIRAMVTPLVTGKYRTEPRLVERIQANYADAILSNTPDDLQVKEMAERRVTLMELAVNIIHERINRYFTYNDELATNGFEPEFQLIQGDATFDGLSEELKLDTVNPVRADMVLNVLEYTYNQSLYADSTFKELANKRIVEELRDETLKVEEAVDYGEDINF